MTEGRLCQWDPRCGKEATNYILDRGFVRTDMPRCEEHAKEQVEAGDGSLQSVKIDDWDTYLDDNSWKVYRVSVAKMEILTDMGRKLIPYTHELAVEGRRMYFNFYFAENVWYVKLGLCNYSPELTEKILARAKDDFGARISEEEPDLRLVDGEVMEDIKVSSVETFFHVLHEEALSLKQAEFFWHFLCNMMGFNYDMELDVALSMAHGVRFRRAT